MPVPDRALGLVTLAVLGGMTALAGCTSLKPRPPDPLPPPAASWSERHGGSETLAADEGAAAALPADRWAVFGDPVLQRLQARAETANLDAQAAALRVLQARVQEQTVKAQRGPQLSATASAARQRQSENGAASRLVNAIGGANAEPLRKLLSAPFTLYDAGFDASWEPDLWGRVARSVDAARADTAGQAAALRLMQLTVRAEVARAYFQLRAAQRQAQLVQAEVTAAEDTTGLLDAQQRNGLTDESALLRQRAQVDLLQGALPALRAQEAQASNQLTLLCGAEPGSLAAELSADTASATDPPLPDLRLGLPADLTRHRPDIAAAEARLQGVTANLGIAMADLYPRIVLGANFGYESVGGGTFGDWGSRQWNVGASLNLPIWDQGRRRSTISLRGLQRQEAAVALQGTALKAWHEVDDAISAYVAESQRQQQLADRLRQTEAEQALARERRKSGLTSELPLLTATMQRLDAERDVVDSRARLNTALASLYKALGDDGAR